MYIVLNKIEIRKRSFYCTVFSLLTHHVMMCRWHRNVSLSFSFSSFFSSSISSFSSLEKWLIVSLLFLSKASSSPLSGSKGACCAFHLTNICLKSQNQEIFSKGACWDFTEGACDLSEMNILDHDRFVDSPGECQVDISKILIQRFIIPLG